MKQPETRKNQLVFLSEYKKNRNYRFSLWQVALIFIVVGVTVGLIVVSVLTIDLSFLFVIGLGIAYLFNHPLGEYFFIETLTQLFIASILVDFLLVKIAEIGDNFVEYCLLNCRLLQSYTRLKSLINICIESYINNCLTYKNLSRLCGKGLDGENFALTLTEEIFYYLWYARFFSERKKQGLENIEGILEFIKKQEESAKKRKRNDRQLNSTWTRKYLRDLGIPLLKET